MQSKCNHLNKASRFLSSNNDNNLNNKYYGKCSKFMKHNLVTGNYTYEYADICRIMKNKCGENGKLFKQNPFLEL